MLILGLNAYHGDSAACVFKDGKLVAAAEEERFRRIKHWAGLPTEAVAYCLREAGATIADVEHIAINRQPGVNNLRRLQFLITHWPDPRLVLQKVRNIRKASGAGTAIEEALGASSGAQIHHVEHHLAHLASAFLVSGFEEAACISIDGFGDFASTAMGAGQGSKIDITSRVYFPHSLGIFYSAITQFIGFPHYGDEYKVMGLAPYGEPKYLAQMREIVRVQPDGTFKLNLKYFRHHTANVSYSWNGCAPEVGVLHTDALAALLGPKRQPGEPLEQKHKDMARSAQAMYEEAFFALLRALHARHPSDNLALSGGCAMNSVANGKVYLNTPFKRMYLPAAAGDAGGAIGAAAIVAAKLKGERPKAKTETTSSEISTSHFSLSTFGKTAYLGPDFSDAEIRELLNCRKADIEA
ncbi:MAG: carbamoyltransferase, partial [Verrucomicrobiota bacterium]|nr:carbamoyltransferase [Verrucomicrobiota bacterium]